MGHEQLANILNSLYLNYFSVCAIVPFTFTLTLAVILLRIPQKSKSTLHLGLVYLLLAVFQFGYIIAATLYHPVAAYHRWITAGIVTLTEVHFIIFVIYYLEDKKSDLVGKIGVSLYALSIAVTIYFIFSTYGSKRVYHFDGHYWDFDADTSSTVVAVLILINLVIMLITGIRKICGSTSKARIYLLAIILIVFGLIAIPATTNLLSRVDYLDRGVYQVTQDLLTIIGFFALFVIYMNTTRDRTTLMMKIMSITLATFLLMFQGLSYFSLTELDKTYDEHRRQELSLAVRAAYFSPEISYCIRYDLDNGLSKIINNSMGAPDINDREVAQSELFNTAQYERIAGLKNLKPDKYRAGLKAILQTDKTCFRGYRNAIEARFSVAPGGPNAAEKILSYIKSLRWRVRYYAANISALPDDRFAEHLAHYLKIVHPDMAPFKTAIIDIMSDGRLSGAALKREVLKIVSRMHPSGIRRYRSNRSTLQHFTAYILVDAERRAVYEAGFDYRTYREYQHPMAMKFIVILAVILVLLFAAFQFFFLGVFVRPMRRILSAINRVRAGNDDIVIPVPVRDELGSISHNFNEMTSALRLSKEVMSDYAENLEKMVQERTEELKNARDALWSEMELARKMQTILIPAEPSIAGYEITGYMLPAEMVGGDYYDIINTDGLDWIVIGDVSGHGVPAGIIMMMVQTSIHTVLAGNPGIRPSGLLDQINSVITDNIRKLNEEKFMTITVLACMDNGVFSASGMHQDILIYRAGSGSIETIRTCGIILGLKGAIDYPPGEMDIRLEPGDIMLLYTDGITESWRKGSVRNRRDPERDMFGLERLQEVFFRNRSLRPDEIRDAILKALDDYALTDDVSMVIIKRNQTPA